MNMQGDRQAHQVIFSMRKEMSITGVREVVSFDEESVVLKSSCGEITVEGAELKVGTLDTEKGVVTLEGRIDSVYYSDNVSEEKHGFFSKIFR